MLLVEQILGNTHEDANLAAQANEAAKQGGLESVRLSFADAQRGRMKVTTDAGTDVGVSIGREGGLHDGDVLFADGQKVIVVSVQSPEVMAIRPPSGLGPQEMFEAGVRLGHVLGNQHWPITWRDGNCIVAVTVDRLVMETVLRHHGVEGLEHEFVGIEPEELAAAHQEPHEHV